MNKLIKEFIKSVIPKKILRNIQKKIDLKKQEKVSKYWDKVLEDYFQNKGLELNIKAKKTEIENNKVIWQFWAQGWDYDKLPDIVKLSYKSIEKNKGDYTVIRLDENTMFEYLEFPRYIVEKLRNKQIWYAHFSDLLRVALLYNYGGVWLDATVYLSDTLPEKYSKYEYFTYQRENNIEFDEKEKYNNLDFTYFSWDKNHKVNMLNSILFSKKNNDIIKTLMYGLLYFWKENDRVNHYYTFQILYDILMKKYYNPKKCDVISDILPHKLNFSLLEKYDEKTFKNLLEQISIHKLNFKLAYNKENIKGTVLEYLFTKEKIEGE